MTVSKVKKLEGALKGFLRTHRLEPVESGLVDSSPGEYRAAFRLSKPDEEILQLQYCSQEHDRVIDIVSGLYPDQIDRRVASRLLIDLASDWIEKENDVRDQEKVTEALSRYLRGLEEEIECYTVYVPINGLEVDSTAGIKIGRSILLSNTKDSEMRHLAQRTNEKLGGNGENSADLVMSPLKKLESVGHSEAKEIRRMQEGSQLSQKRGSKKGVTRHLLFTSCSFSFSLSCLLGPFVLSLLDSVTMDPPHIAHCG